MPRFSPRRDIGAATSGMDVSSGPPARIDVVDGLRGFALLGILVINLGAFSNAPGSPPDFFSDVPHLDRGLQTLILLVVESKFFSLFSLLFGLSFALQIESAARQGAAFGPRIARRLAALLGFGILHVLLVWDGDILIMYAVVGAVLVAFRNASERTLRRWIIGLLAVPLTAYLLILAVVVVGRWVPAAQAALASLDAQVVDDLGSSVADRTELLRTGSYGEIALARWQDYLATLPLLLSRTPTILAMFLTGMWVGRRRILRDPETHRPWLRRVCRTTWSIGAPVQILVGVASLTLAPATALVALFLDQAFTGPILAIAYASTLVLVAHTRAGAAAIRFFSPAGRMALTTYLTQSVILSFVFWSWGAARVGQTSTAAGLGIAVTIYVAQAGAAHLWLRRFRYGPLEWVWRCLTYARRQPLVRR